MSSRRSDPTRALERIANLSEDSGLRSVGILAFRDVEDEASGGSEIHVAHLAENLSQAGVEVEIHTGRVAGRPARLKRGAASVHRSGGRVGVFPKTAFDLWREPLRKVDAVIEIAHGLPFFLPLIRPNLPQVCFVHHVHLGTWQELLPGPAGRLGDFMERHLVAPVYRNRTILTGAESAKEEIIEAYRVQPSRIRVIPHGIETAFVPGGHKAPNPTVLAVARLMPQKGLVAVVESLARIRESVPSVSLRIVGTGPQRPELEALIRRHGLEEEVTLVGWVDQRRLIDEYRSAWVTVSASMAEGFGLTLLESSSCGTPVVASDIPGHRDAVVDSVTGMLREVGEGFDRAVIEVLMDEELRRTMSRAGLEHASKFSWEASAEGIFDALVDAFESRRR